jgi:hypothetical protein
MTKGLIFLIGGIAALIGVYSLRPPSGFGDAMMMMGQGRSFFLKEPIYLGLMAISGIMSLFGLVFIGQSITNKK